MPVVTIVEAIEGASAELVQASATIAADVGLESTIPVHQVSFEDAHPVIRLLFPYHSLYFWLPACILIAVVVVRLVTRLVGHIREKYPIEHEPLLISERERQWLKRRWGISVMEEVVEPESAAAVLLRERRLQRNLREMGLL